MRSLSVVEVETSTTLSDQKYPNHLDGCYMKEVRQRMSVTDLTDGWKNEL